MQMLPSLSFWVGLRRVCRAGKFGLLFCVCTLPQCALLSKRLLPSLFLDLLHPQDRPALATLLQTTVLQALAPEKSTLRCRLHCGKEQSGDYKVFDITVAYATIGIICSSWEIRHKK
jgi:hypothetical protein